MKKITISTTLVVLFFTFLPYIAKGQERVVPMPNRQQLQSAHVRVLFQDSEGYMWYGMKMDGLYRDDGYTLTSFRADFLHPEIQMNNNIMALCEDKFQRLWIGTKRGLYILDKHDYSIRPTGDKTLQTWTIDALKASTGDSVWAYANKHLLVYDRDGKCVRQEPYDENPLVTQSRKEITDQRGNVWQIDDDGIPSVQAEPLMKLEEVDLETLPLRCVLPTNRSGVLPPEHRVHAVWDAIDDTKWVGTSEGLWMVRPDREPEQVGPNFGVVNTLSPGDDGTVYMNTEWQGLISYKDGLITKLDTAIRNATDLFWDDNKLWICTADGRVLRYDVEKKKQEDMSAELNLLGDVSAGIVVLKGCVWLLFNQRLIIYSPERKVLHYIFPFDLYPQPVFFRRLYTDGVSRVYLECERKCYELVMKDDSNRPAVSEKVTLSAYQTIHGTYSLGLGNHELNVASDERVVHLFFTTFDHLNTRHIRYAFRRGGEEEWQYLEMGQNDARITQLSAGENIIEVKATNANGEWGTEVTTITIHCEHYWWETVWALVSFGVLAAILLGVSFWLWRKVKRKRAKKQQESTSNNA